MGLREEDQIKAIMVAVGQDDLSVQAWEKAKWVKSVKLRP